MAAAQAVENHRNGKRPDLMRDIYINSNLDPPTKVTITSRNTKFKDILPRKSIFRNISQKGYYSFKFEEKSIKMQIKVLQFSGNCKAEFEAFESYRRNI